LTPLDIGNAVNTQNPDAAVGDGEDREHTIYGANQCDAASIDDLNMMRSSSPTCHHPFLKDVAQVRDGSLVQQNIVRRMATSQFWLV